jgi:hypothetical protein
MCCLLGGFLGILIVRTIVHRFDEKYQGDFFSYQPAVYQRR